MNILITGGGGFIGSHAANTFADEGHDVIVLDNFSFGSKEHCGPTVWKKWVERQIVQQLVGLLRRLHKMI